MCMTSGRARPAMISTMHIILATVTVTVTVMVTATVTAMVMAMVTITVMVTVTITGMGMGMGMGMPSQVIILLVMWTILMHRARTSRPTHLMRVLVRVMGMAMKPCTSMAMAMRLIMHTCMITCMPTAQGRVPQSSAIMWATVGLMGIQATARGLALAIQAPLTLHMLHPYKGYMDRWERNCKVTHMGMSTRSMYLCLLKLSMPPARRRTDPSMAPGPYLALHSYFSSVLRLRRHRCS
mmetsp:Transcript_110466/g.191432  ORF Transcript_110466/g.191432 Transcript_110466/m.191432 type:complete len:238 (-) Transcript_110466:447-1160(-)